MSSDDTQKLIEQAQRDIDAYQSEMQTARDRQQDDQIPGFQQKVNKKTSEISALQKKLGEDRLKEKKEATKAAYEEGKDDGESSGLFRL